MSSLLPYGSNYYYDPSNGQMISKQYRDKVVENEKKINASAVFCAVCFVGGGACVGFAIHGFAKHRATTGKDIFDGILIAAGVVLIIVSIIFCCMKRK